MLENGIINLGLSVRWVYDIKGVLGAKPPAQDEKGGGVGGAFPQAAPRTNAALAAFVGRNKYLRIYVDCRVAAAL